MVRGKVKDAHNAFFEVPAKRKGQKLILFEKIDSELMACESSGGNYEPP